VFFFLMVIFHSRMAIERRKSQATSDQKEKTFKKQAQNNVFSLRGIVRDLFPAVVLLVLV